MYSRDVSICFSQTLIPSIEFVWKKWYQHRRYSRLCITRMTRGGKGVCKQRQSSVKCRDYEIITLMTECLHKYIFVSVFAMKKQTIQKTLWKRTRNVSQDCRWQVVMTHQHFARFLLDFCRIFETNVHFRSRDNFPIFADKRVVPVLIYEVLKRTHLKQRNIVQKRHRSYAMSLVFGLSHNSDRE